MDRLLRVDAGIGERLRGRRRIAAGEQDGQQDDGNDDSGRDQLYSKG
jgi:hypothetical protein